MFEAGSGGTSTPPDGLRNPSDVAAAIVTRLNEVRRPEGPYRAVVAVVIGIGAHTALTP